VYVIGGHPLPIVVSNNSNFILINKVFFSLGNVVLEIIFFSKYIGILEFFFPYKKKKITMHYNKNNNNLGKMGSCDHHLLKNSPLLTLLSSLTFGTLKPTRLDITLTLRSVSSLNNPQNSEMKLCENIKLTC
jgi:hypothetical protein